MKKLIAVLIVAVMVMGFAACSPADNTTTIKEDVTLDVTKGSVTTNSYTLQGTSGQAKQGVWGYWNEAYPYNKQATAVYEAFGITGKEISTAMASADTRFQSLTVNGLAKLMNHPGTYVILFGGAWCPNTQAIFPYVNAWAYANGIQTVYNFDFFLDGQFGGYDFTAFGGSLNGKDIWTAAMNWAKEGLDSAVTDSLDYSYYGGKDTPATTHLRSNQSQWVALYKDIMIRLTNYTTSNGSLWMVGADGGYVQMPKMSVPCVIVYDRDNNVMTATGLDTSYNSISGGSTYNGLPQNGMAINNARFITEADVDTVCLLKMDLGRRNSKDEVVYDYSARKVTRDMVGSTTTQVVVFANSVPYYGLQTEAVQTALKAGNQNTSTTPAAGIVEDAWNGSKNTNPNGFIISYVKGGERLEQHGLYPVLGKLEAEMSWAQTQDPTSYQGKLQLNGLNALLNVIPAGVVSTPTYNKSGAITEYTNTVSGKAVARYSYFQNASEMPGHVQNGNIHAALTVNPENKTFKSSLNVAYEYDAVAEKGNATNSDAKVTMTKVTQHTTGLRMATGDMPADATNGGFNMALTTANQLFGKAIPFMMNGDTQYENGSDAYVNNNSGCHLKPITYAELMYLANTSGDWIVLFGGEWCGYTAAAGSTLNWVVNNNAAVTTSAGTGSNFPNLTVYVMDLRLDGFTGTLFMRNNSSALDSTAVQVNYKTVSAVVVGNINGVPSVITNITGNGTGSNAGKIVSGSDVYNVPASSANGVISSFKLRLRSTAAANENRKVPYDAAYSASGESGYKAKADMEGVRKVWVGKDGIIYFDNYSSNTYNTYTGKYADLKEYVVLDNVTFKPSVINPITDKTGSYETVWSSSTNTANAVYDWEGKITAAGQAALLYSNPGSSAATTSVKIKTVPTLNSDGTIDASNVAFYTSADNAFNYAAGAQKTDPRFAKDYLVVLYYFRNYVDGYWFSSPVTINTKKFVKIGAPTILIYNKDAKAADGSATPCVTWVGVDHNWNWVQAWSEIVLGNKKISDGVISVVDKNETTTKKMIDIDAWQAYDMMQRVTSQLTSLVQKAGFTTITTYDLVASETKTTVVTNVTKA